MWQTSLLIIHVFVSLALLGLVLLQQGKGSTAAAGFGGASQTLFGSRGPASFLFKLTAVLGFVFFATSLSLTYLASKSRPQSPLLELADQVKQYEQTHPQSSGPRNVLKPLTVTPEKK